ncbi:S8 family peptidase [Streptomyces bauhiniae]|uniref:S8 family peptidase n=1 Tax=Streptomyces bauhiniae TaxID=2340725 RepID=UPI0035DA37F2
MVSAAASSGPAQPAGAAHLPSAGGSHTVTLITGDKVTVGTAADGTPVNSFESPDGISTGYQRVVLDGSTYVYPNSALSYVSSGVLDKRLFNVTQLIADGYDDAHTTKLPLIVRYTDAAARSRTAPKVAGASVVRPLESIQGAAVTQNRAQAPAFWSALTGGAATAAARSAHPALAGGIAKVWLDGKAKADLSESTAQIGAPQVWAGGNTAQGVKVAILDTGVDTDHPDLAGQVDDGQSFVPSEPDITDYNGHGTHTASTIAGTGAASDGLERGVASGARLEVGKVLDSDGSGQDSWIIAGMEWAAQDEHAKIISMSLGASGGTADDPMSQAVEQLSGKTGALFVIASGNSGPHTIGSPGAADAALTVGAVDAHDQLADFSSQGPRDGDDGLKPEITAPGVDIIAARSQYLRGNGNYTSMSGTSMATPHVAGTAALLAAAHPGWTGPQLKQALVSSSKATARYTPYQAGAGRVDAVAAVHTSVFGTTTAYAGYHTWPVTPGAKDVRTVTYTNTGAAPVTLDLATTTGLPAGLFALSADRVTVPAHGSTPVTLTTAVDLLPADKPVDGMVTATDSTGTVRAKTLIGGSREGRRQNLTVVAKDRSGKPLAGNLVLVAPHLWTSLTLDASGTATARLPVGSYSGWLISDVQGATGPHSLGMALLGLTDVTLDKDRTVTLDGRKAKQILARTPQRTTAIAPRLDVSRTFANQLVSTSMLPNSSYDSIWALPTGKKVTEGTFEFGARFRLEEPALELGTKSTAYSDPLVKRAATPMAAGTRTLSAVYATDTSAAALARYRVRGKAVVVRLSDTSSIGEAAAAASAAGARLLVVVHDGTGRLQPWDETPWDPASPAPLTVASLNADQGTDLIAAIQRGDGDLKVTSHPTTDYVYDVVRHWTGAVPADPTWRYSRDHLARVDVSFRNYRPGKAMEYRADVWQGWTVGNQLVAPAQGERTDWVDADTDWTDDAYIRGETGQHSPEPVRYSAFRTNQVNWFGPIQRPRMGPAGYQPVRYLDTMYLPAPGWGDGGGHLGDAGGNFAVKDLVSLYQGDQQLNWGNAEYLQVSGLPTEAKPYRLVVDNDRAAWAAPYSTHTLTEWNFTSAVTGADAAAPLPLIQLDYGVDTDKAGRADRRADLTVTASQLPGVTAAVGKVSVDLSYDDGKTWQHADLGKHGAGWRTALRAPRSAGFVSLRVSARDSGGDTVSQTLTRAFGLR